MRRIKSKLLAHKASIEASEERRKVRDQKKYGKQIRAEKLREKAKAKRDHMAALKNWRKDGARGGDASAAVTGGNRGDDLDSFSVDMHAKKGGAAGKDFGGGKKFGAGGKDFGKKGGKDFGGKKGGKKQPQKRPGKKARDRK